MLTDWLGVPRGDALVLLLLIVIIWLLVDIRALLRQIARPK